MEPSPRNIMNIQTEKSECNPHMAVDRIPYLISINLTSKIKVALPGIPGTPLLPYARLAGMVSLRSAPIDIPATPMSQPLMTSPAPNLKENGLPFLFAAEMLVSVKHKKWGEQLTIEDLAILELANVAHANNITLLAGRTGSKLLVIDLNTLNSSDTKGGFS